MIRVEGTTRELHSLRLSGTIQIIGHHDNHRDKVFLVIRSPAEDFLRACGARAPLPIEVEHSLGQESVRLPLNVPFAVIGRDARADLRLDDAEISHRHAYLQLVGGQLWCVDLGSRTGTHWKTGGQLIGPLSSRRSVRIGPYTIHWRDEHSPDENAPAASVNPLSSESDDPSLFPRVALEFRGGTNSVRTWMVDRVLTLVGRASFCKVRLHSSMVSRVHCAFLNTSDGVWVVDLLGREGIYVNEMAVRWAKLENADELHIDQFRVRVRYLTPPRCNLPAKGLMQMGTDEQGLTQKTSEKIPSYDSSLGANPCSFVTTSSSQTLVHAALSLPRNEDESLLLPLISQFSLMQQQMFDQFQQTLLLMAQMFAKLHQEQMAVVRQELDQIQDLTRQLQLLQSECTRSPQAQPATVALPFRHSERAHSSTVSPPPPADAPARCEADVHAWLSQRLATLHQERHTRWQSLLRLLTGK